MKFYPYSKIETSNLKSLLVVARLLGALSYILIVIAILITIVGFLTSFSQPIELEGGITATMPNLAGGAVVMGLWVLVSSLFLLAFSGICAAVVSCENKFTSKVS